MGYHLCQWLWSFLPGSKAWGRLTTLGTGVRYQRAVGFWGPRLRGPAADGREGGLCWVGLVRVSNANTETYRVGYYYSTLMRTCVMPNHHLRWRRWECYYSSKGRCIRHK
ncbi:hypothetical protein BKA67DRAFT_249344 [Truncatella angustata]|uniref:Secreted protein n=1 Tax=Truncatella angustata TaxID=152316 RepID=A0A9P8UP67_9PEZI|nr:uncharacterized protein BKA67DRAFT_249344 [Truncatella angustata]KAH6655770.1 hypothetical protein BKA67DRAFT_249344 [Truncatella angustata]